MEIFVNGFEIVKWLTRMVIRSSIIEHTFFFLWVERESAHFLKTFVMVLVFDSCRKEESKEVVLKNKESIFSYFCENVESK
jgi:hypothetical protein